jgi:uncharacterized protein
VVQVRIDLENRAGSKSAFAHAYAPGELELSDDRVRLDAPPEVSGTLAIRGKRILLSGRLTGQAQVDCDRCLRPVDLPVAAVFSLQYVTQLEFDSAPAVELEEDDLVVSIYDGESIDIDELVREQLLLAVPERTLCREDCQGLCQVCGADRNLKECGCQTTETDPRWAALKKLRI